MAFYMNMMALNEGEQAEEYMRKKQEKIDKEKEDFKNRYSDHVGIRNVSSRGDGARAEDKYDYPNAYIDNKLKYDTKANEQRKKADSVTSMRDKYPDAMPKGKTADEKASEKYSKDTYKEVDYGRRVATDYKKGVRNPDGSKFARNDNPDYIAAKDAARRHWRREAKKGNVLEQGIFSECYFLDEE